MGWECRGKNGNRYFYRSVRVGGGKVEKRYYGRGPMGQLAANLDAAAQVERKTAVEAWKERKRQEKSAEAVLNDFCRECDVSVAVALTAAGYHEKQGQWRKRRA